MTSPAPRTPWNASITPHRRFAYFSHPLDDYKTIKALQDFQARLWTQASKISSQMGGHMPEFGGKDISGVPIEMKDFAGPVPTTMVVTKANSGVAGKALAVPKGYRAKALPSMGGAPGAMPGAMPK